jgi:hypothetical protein
MRTILGEHKLHLLQCLAAGLRKEDEELSKSQYGPSRKCKETDIENMT